MRRRILRDIKYLVAGAALLLSGSALAQVPRCAPHADLVTILDQTFDEHQQGYGLIEPRAVLEIYASEKGGWTIIATGTDGISCVLAVGLGWENVPQPVREPAGKAPEAGSSEPPDGPAQVDSPT
jgi:hypothetical protein